MEEYRRSAFVGSAAQVAERIEELAKRLNVREMAVVTWATDEPAHRKSYELLAKP
jgi:alkanesulfonate monooxygenase SsuD/methylene tetrahydromethanopterin reductase-like flavin-dependent oxidoreductase (luciferase family)